MSEPSNPPSSQDASAQGASLRLPEPGELVAGRFRITSVLGKGGFGTVYRAHQVSIGRDVALKCMDPRLTDDPVQIERFRREALHISQLRHPNTVTLYDYGQTNEGLFYIVMELVRGEPLAQVIQREGGLGSARTLRIFKQMCQSLGEAHTAGVVHRDLKPENILLCDIYREPDFVKVLDFGLAKHATGWSANASPQLTAMGKVFGTPMYMAPEQVSGEQITPATDVYALGLLLFETLTGRVPVEGDNRLQIMRKQLNAPVPVLETPLKDHPIAPVILRCTLKQPEQRYANAEALLSALEAVEAQGVALAPVPPTGDAGRLRVTDNGALQTQPTPLERLEAISQEDAAHAAHAARSSAATTDPALEDTQEANRTLIVEVNTTPNPEVPLRVRSEGFSTLATKAPTTGPNTKPTYGTPNSDGVPHVTLDDDALGPNTAPNAPLPTGMEPLGTPDAAALLNPQAFCRRPELRALMRWSETLVDPNVESAKLVTCFGEPGAGKSRLMRLWLAWLVDPRGPKPKVLAGRGICSPAQLHPLDTIREALLDLQRRNALDLEALIQDAPSPREAAALQAARDFLSGGDPQTQDAPAPVSVHEPRRGFASTLFAGLGQLLARLAQDHPVVLILDDIDQASFATVAFVQDLEIGLPVTPWPIALMVTGRSDSMAANPELQRPLQRYRQGSPHGILDVPLERLDQPRAMVFIGQLLPASDDLKSYVFELSLGNPLYIVHILRHLHATDRLIHNGEAWTHAGVPATLDDPTRPPDVPATLLDLLLVRIEQAIARHTRLPRLKFVLHWLAVLGQRIEPGLLQRAMHLDAPPEDELNALVEEGLIVRDAHSGTVTFDHLLVREALLKEVHGLRSAPNLHRAAAEAKLAHAQDQRVAPPWLEVAWHFQRAGDEDAWRAHLGRAAQQARNSLDRRRARELYLSFLRGLNDQTDPDGLSRLEAWNALGQLCENLGELGPAEDYYRLAAQAAAQRGLTLEQARAMRGRSRVLILQNRLGAARPLSEAVIGLAQHTQDAREQALALITFTELVSRIGDQRALISHVSELKRLLPSIQDPAVQAKSLLHLGELAKRSGDNEASIAYQEQALALFEQTQDQQGISDALCALGFHAVQAQDNARAEELLHQALSLKEAIADRQGTGQVLNNLALHAFRNGQIERAHNAIERALSMFRSIGSQYSLGTSLINKGLILTWMRDYHDADACFQEALGILQSVGDRIAASVCLTNQGIVALNRLDRDRARQLFRESRRLKIEASSTLGMRQVLINLAFVAAWDGEFEAAERLLLPLLDTRTIQADEAAVIHTMLGVLHIFSGRLQSSVLNLQRALANAEDGHSVDVLALCRANAAFYAATTRQDTQLAKLARAFDPGDTLASIEPYAWLVWLESMIFALAADHKHPRLVQAMTLAVAWLYNAYGFGDDSDRIMRGAIQRR